MHDQGSLLPDGGTSRGEVHQIHVRPAGMEAIDRARHTASASTPVCRANRASNRGPLTRITAACPEMTALADLDR